MAEAIITRSTVIPEDVLNPIYPVEGRHIALATLKDSSGNRVSNVMIRCQDGNTWYNYVTNEQGQIKISSNSGTLNFYVGIKAENNVVFLDQKNISKLNVAAPIGDTLRLDLQYDGYKSGEALLFTSGSSTNDHYQAPYLPKQFTFLDTNNVDLCIGGGGGGGQSGYWVQWSYGSLGGCGGEFKEIKNISISHSQVYSGSIGSGGGGGQDPNENMAKQVSGNTGGSTTIFGYVANGGNGGGASYSNYGTGICNFINKVNKNYAYKSWVNSKNTNNYTMSNMVIETHPDLNSNISFYGGAGGGFNVVNPWGYDDDDDGTWWGYDWSSGSNVQITVPYMLSLYNSKFRSAGPSGGYPYGGQGAYLNAVSGGSAYSPSAGQYGAGGGGGYMGNVVNSAGKRIWYHSGGAGGAGIIKITF